MRALTRDEKLSLGSYTAAASALALIFAAFIFVTKQRLSLETPANATIANVWTEGHLNKSQAYTQYYARLVFDRKQSDGTIVHCDVPRVKLGANAPVSTTLKIFPRPTSCWDPDFLDVSDLPGDRYIPISLVISLASAVLSFLLFRSVVREKEAEPAS